ncbi:uncharacterized protein LOC106804419 [Setaria italica]|uniref:uncharacterized protein LOC106804419 n=1 Tax=Setaria italica TaxID=4555 RepID=UPI000BE4CC74|nr:uncharacterized protein LOC106804419 [Setaria italica]
MTSPAAAAQHPRVLLRFTHNTLRIPEELAAEIGADRRQGQALAPRGRVGRRGRVPGRRVARVRRRVRSRTRVALGPPPPRLRRPHPQGLRRGLLPQGARACRSTTCRRS